MPALPPVPKTIRVQFNYVIGSDVTALTRLYFLYTGGPPTSADLNALSASFSTAWGTNLKALMPSAWSLSGIGMIDLDTTSGAQGQSLTAVSGTRTGGTLNAATTVLINWVIARRYRGGKPRSFFPFGVQGDTTSPQKWGGTFVTSVNTGVNGFIAAVSGATSGTTSISSHISVSYYQGFTNVPYGSPQKYRRVPTLRSSPATDVITQGNCSTIFGTQRRRLRP